MKKLVELKKDYLDYLDKKARHISYKLTANLPVTSLLMEYISDLYDSANTEKIFAKDKNFEAAYHQPITSELEFLVARILFHFSKKNNLGWTIYLRKQKKDRNTNKLVVPDVKIEKDGKLIGIIEIKAKAGWMQPFFKKSNNDKDPYIASARSQLTKYASFENCGKDNVYVLLPTLTLVSRKHSTHLASDYRQAFATNSQLDQSNLILLSNNVFLDLSGNNHKKEYQPTNDFEKFINKLRSK